MKFMLRPLSFPLSLSLFLSHSLSLSVSLFLSLSIYVYVYLKQFTTRMSQTSTRKLPSWIKGLWCGTPLPKETLITGRFGVPAERFGDSH